MRMAFGLVGLLVGLGVVVWIMSQATLPATKHALDTRKKLEPQVEQMAGRTADGTRAGDTFKVDAEQRGGKLVGVKVTEVTAGGAMDKHFGLAVGDIVTQIGPLPVSGMGGEDEAKDYLVAEYQRGGTITVLREGLTATLPLPANSPAAAARAKRLEGKPTGTGTGTGTSGAGTSGTGASGSGGTGGTGGASQDSLQKQLDAIPGVR